MNQIKYEEFEFDNQSNDQDLDKFSSQYEISLDYQVKKKNNKYYFCFLIIGLMNNVGFVTVQASASNYCIKFNKLNLIGLIQFCLSCFSFFSRTINSKYLINYSHNFRIKTMLFLQSLSFGCLSLANHTNQIWGFYLGLVAISMIGVCCSLGETVILGFSKYFPSDLIGGWSSGTGLAGIIGAGFYVFLKSINFEDENLFKIYAFLISFTYYICFTWLDTQKNIYNYSFSSNLNQKKVSSEENVQTLSSNSQLTFKNFKIILSKIKYFACNLGLVYFLEYCCITGFAKYSNEYQINSFFYGRYAYEILLFCYQIGVLISRSSLSCIKISNLYLVSISQFINFILWLTIAYIKWAPLYIQFLLMFWTGLMGGLSYVNSNYQLLESKIIHVKQKELAINVCYIFNDIAILLASIFVLIASNTIFK